MTTSAEWEQARRVGYALAERLAAESPGNPYATPGMVDLVIRYHQAIERVRLDPESLDFALSIIPARLSPEWLAALVADLESIE